MHIPTIQRSETLPPPPSGVMPPVAPSERLVPVMAPLAWLVIKGTLLTILTLGIYRFWYRTALRRYYWRNTTLAGDGFEYTGTGKELFVGFLIALAIVLPLYFGVTLVGLFGGQVLGPILATILGSFIMPAVVQVLIYRARRYRLTRTRYRGVRFHQSGTGLGYLFHTVKWLILTVLTLGIVFPYLRRALERYKTENTWYGSAQGAFDARAKPLMKSWLLLWFLALFAFLLLVVSSVLVSTLGSNSLVLGLLALAMLLAVPFAWVNYRVIEFQSFVGGTSFGGISLASDLNGGSVIWIWVRYYLLLIGIALGAIVLGWIMGIRPRIPVNPNDVGAVVQAPLVLLAAGAFMAMVLTTEILFRRKLWALRVASITVTNVAALDAIVQTAGQDAIGVGEAFDTGFDIAG
ncbi:MAG: hypothetical protein FD175_1742 [Beijerinckiaceae bacterium]|nr:MAG: hypothetical protein FD175_1742 [Beijerinckiaceae bacterium]